MDGCAGVHRGACRAPPTPAGGRAWSGQVRVSCDCPVSDHRRLTCARCSCPRSGHAECLATSECMGTLPSGMRHGGRGCAHLLLRDVADLLPAGSQLVSHLQRRRSGVGGPRGAPRALRRCVVRLHPSAAAVQGPAHALAGGASGYQEGLLVSCSAHGDNLKPAGKCSDLMGQVHRRAILRIMCQAMPGKYCDLHQPCSHQARATFHYGRMPFISRSSTGRHVIEFREKIP